MSSVDNRIVKMQFDNGSFERNAHTTISTLDRLKQALNLSGAAKGLEGISTAASKVDLGHIAEGAESANNSFSVLGTAAAIVLGNIATKAIEVGATVAKSFVLDPVIQGFQEYELKMNSIQTMLMSTGEPLERVNQKLDELNTYADRTIYSFSDMTSNIGKFTNAGVSLDKSVAAIQGVANVAALSGANATEASHAMYNFGQALSAGAVRLVDWKSIEVANMATVEFKNELISTALAMGTLVQQGDKYVSTTTDLNGKVSEAFNATTMFNDSLSSQWMTTEVLTETLNRYADETTEIGKKAFKAATQVKTFSQLIDTTKESIGSGWAQSFEIIFGDFNEALELWTSVSQVIDGFVSKQADARNEMLRTWKDLGGRTNAIQGLTNILSALGDIMGAIGRAWEKVFPPMTGTRLALITKGFLDFTETLKPSEGLLKSIQAVFEGVFSVISFGMKVISPFVSIVLKLVGVFFDLVGVVIRILSPLGSFISFLNNAVLSTTHLRQASRLVKSALDGLLEPVRKFGELFKPVFDKAEQALSSFGTASERTYAKIFNAVKNFNLEDALEPLISFGSMVVKIFAGIGLAIGQGLMSIGSYISKQDWFVDLSKQFSEYRDEVVDKFKSLIQALEPYKEDLGKALQDIFDAIKNLDIQDLEPIMEKASEGIRNGLNTMRENLETFKDWIDQYELDAKAKAIFNDVADGLGVVKDVIGNVLSDMRGAFDSFADWIGTLTFEDIKNVFGVFGDALSNIVDILKSSIGKLPNVISSAFDLVGAAIQGGADILAGAFNTTINGITSAWESGGHTIVGFIREIGSLIGDALNFLFEKFELTADIFGRGMQKLFDLFSNEQFGANLETGIFGIIAVGVKNLLDALSAFTKDGTKIIKGVTEVLDGVRGCLEAYQKSIKADNLMTIAKSIAILAASIVVLAMIPVDRLGTAIAGISAAAVELMVAMAILSKITDKSDFSGMGKLSLAMVTLASSTLILSLALKTISSLSWQELAVGLVGVTALIVELVAVSMVLSRNEVRFTKGVTSMLMFAIAIKEMGKAVANMASLDLASAAQGIISIGLLIAALTTFVRVAKLSEISAGSGVAVAAIALGVIMMANSVSLLGGLNVPELQRGLASLAIILAEIGLLSKVMNGVTGIAGAGAGMIALGIAMLEFAGVVAIFGNMQLDTLAQGLIALGVALTELALASKLMSGTLTSSIAILALASALLVLTPVIITLGSVPWQVLAIGLGTIAAAFVILGVAGYALAPVAPIIAALAVSLLAIGAAVVVAAAGLTGFGIALTAIAAGLVAFSAVSTVAINAFLLSLELLIAGILRMVAHVSKDLADAAAAIVIALASAITNAAPYVGEAITALVVMIADIIIGAAPSLVEAGMTLVVSLLQGISSHMYEITDAAVKMITEFINAIADNLEGIVQAGMNLAIEFINAIAEGLRDNMEPLIAAVANLISAVFEGMITALQSMVSAIPMIGEDLANELEGVKEGIRETFGVDEMSQIGQDAMGGLTTGLQNGSTTTTQTAQQLGFDIKNQLSDSIGDLTPIGEMKITDFSTGMTNMSGLAFSSGAFVGNNSVAGLETVTPKFPEDGNLFGTDFSEALSGTSGLAQSSGDLVGSSAEQAVNNHVPAFNPMGNEAGSNWASGISSQSGAASTAGDSIGASAVSAVNGHVGEFNSLGVQAGQGFAAGIAGQIQNVATQAGNMVREAIAAAKAAQDSNSPSKEFMKLGVWADEGMILGYKQKENEVSEAASDMVKNSLNGVGSAIDEAMASVNDSADFQPRIVPVIDLTEANHGVQEILSSLNGVDAEFQMSARVAADVVSKDAKNEILMEQLSQIVGGGYNRLNEAVSTLKEDMKSMVRTLTGLKVVMDNGILVGELAGPMDEALGMRQLYEERGM